MLVSSTTPGGICQAIGRVRGHGPR
jgi:hypothetical protein